MLTIHIHENVILYLQQRCFCAVTLSVSGLRGWIKGESTHMTVNLVENSAFCQFWYKVQVTDRAKVIQLRRVVTHLTAGEITYNNFEISLVVFMPNITTNHAITYTNEFGGAITHDPNSCSGNSTRLAARATRQWHDLVSHVVLLPWQSSNRESYII